MTASLERYTERHPHAVDAVTVLALFACAVLGAKLSTSGASRPEQEWPAELLAAISCLAVFRARSHPRTAVAVTAVSTVATGALGYLLSPLLLAPVMTALYWLATLTDPKPTRVYGAATMAVVVTTTVLDDPTGDTLLLRTVAPFIWLLLPLAAGSKASLRRAYLESMQARAAHAERTREEEARLRVAEERMRIARELHDVVAHHMAVANAQAGTAAHLAPTHPEQAQKILADLTGTTSSALLELRATVGLLRQADDPDSLEPSPGLDRLPELISACESAGLDVTVTTEGEPQPLSPGVDLTAYRIIQEALTNVTRHAAGHAAHVRLAYSGSRLLIRVTNDGTATTAPADLADGFGLMGMRERAHSIGGDLSAGPLPEGGFEVTTALPFHPHALKEHEATP
ncbi:Histidine kinase [Nonomuraea solani]|uniref:histidine kinase n=1 Tax=Nonomuraea solani TaxID=1144553 RepID=A0A1H6EQX6_9ACTN|nr:sensor histidine kinase [Nonomuraea solani]SEH00260.1 Histidine kinase [Nonomuraea solani]